MFRCLNVNYLQQKFAEMSAGKHLSESEKKIIRRLASEVKAQRYIFRIVNNSRAVINALKQPLVKKKLNRSRKMPKTLARAIIWKYLTGNYSVGKLRDRYEAPVSILTVQRLLNDTYYQIYKRS